MPNNVTNSCSVFSQMYNPSAINKRQHLWTHLTLWVAYHCWLSFEHPYCQETRNYSLAYSKCVCPNHKDSHFHSGSSFSWILAYVKAKIKILKYLVCSPSFFRWRQRLTCHHFLPSFLWKLLGVCGCTGREQSQGITIYCWARKLKSC